MTVLRELSFSNAKSGLSTVMDEVVHEHRPQLVQRHRGREAMILVKPEDVRRWLDTFRLELNVILDEGEVAISAEPIGIIGVGATFDAALDDLVEEIRAYAKLFFDRVQFYVHTQAVRHEPWLLRFALTPPDEQRALLEGDIEASAPKANRSPASTV